MRSRAIHSRSCPKRCRPLAAGGHTGRPHEDLRGRAAALCFVLLEALASQSAAEDCNGNGRPDSDDVAPTHIAFGAPREFQAALEDGGARGPAFADFDQDGNLDVLLMDNQNVYLLRNVGGGTFEQPVTLWYGIAPSGVVAPDLDQDGSPDVASWEGGEASLIVLRNRGDGTFADAEKQPLGVQVDFLSAANLDQNRAPDLVLAGGILSGSLVILRNDGRAGFTVEKHPMPGEPSALLVADFDGDRSSDILIPAVEDDLRHPPRVVHDFLYRNNGDGTFALAKDLGLVGGAFAADFDGDGDVDLADYGYHLFRNRGDASFSERETIDLPIRFSTALVGDVDGDARPDFY